MGALRLPRLLSDGMVLQRDRAARIHGCAAPSATVRLTFSGQFYTAKANAGGAWEITLPPVPAGGPYTLTAEASGEALVVRDILFGDVWVASGQSNMELPMSRVRDLYAADMAAADNPHLRHFWVPRTYNFHGPRDDYPGGVWEAVTPETIPRFFATAYFFADSLYRRYGVPIGLIASAAGGTPVQAWMSREALAPFPAHLAELERCEDERVVNEKIQFDKTREADWYAALNSADAGLRDGFYQTDYDDAAWPSRPLTAPWDDDPALSQNGAFWFRTTFEVPARLAGRPAVLRLGCVRDADTVYVNGQTVGATAYQYPPRIYELPETLLREGTNSIVARVVSIRNTGGFVAGKPYKLIVDGQEISLEHDWKYHVGAFTPALPEPENFEAKPAGLFNAMIAPALPQAIRGVIWYQGESNTGAPWEYDTLFRGLVADWRVRWGQGDFPFLFVQLAGYVTPHIPATQSLWPVLREKQRACLDIPNTAMAVTLDVGEANDLHPLNKREVGRRLALAAFRLAYGEDVEHSGPLARKATRRENNIYVNLSHADGLAARSAPLEVEISGADGVFTSCRADIVGDALVVRGAPAQAASVRYAWADSPAGALLYNAEGLPAAPFLLDIEG